MGISVGGLASGLDTTSIINSLMSIESQAKTRLTTQDTTERNNRTALQTAVTTLNALRTAAQGLSDPSLFGNVQTATAADATKVAATVTGGAAAGGYELRIDSLARASQASYAFASPAADGTLTLAGDGWSDVIDMAAGTTADDLVARINADASLHVVASRTTVGGVERLVLASRATGADSGFTATASAPGALADEQLRAGQDAVVQVDGVEHRSASNVVADAIPGVRLELRATTGGATTGITVGVPGVDPDKVKTAAKGFVDAYNAAINLLRTQTANDPSGTKGVLAADSTMNGILESLRDTLVAVAGDGSLSLPLQALGITNGAASGTAAYSPDAIKGLLSFDETAFAAAMSDPAAVRQTLTGADSVVTKLSDLIGSYTGSAGSLTARISAQDELIADIGRRMTDMDARLQAKQDALTAQFARLETNLAAWQQQSSWLSSQLAALGS